MTYYYIGLMLAQGANSDSGVAVVDKNNEIILLDKLFTMQDVQYFFENFSSLKDAQVCISLPSDNSMINGKWRLLSKQYQFLASNPKFKNIDNWTQRFSTRGCDYFNSLVSQGIKINRFEMFLTRQSLGLSSCFKDRSPADCKALQSALKLKYGYSSLLSNMMPMAQMEALVGAILARKICEQNEETPQDRVFDFNGIPVIR